MRIVNPVFVLRVAAVVTLLFAAGHLYGGLASWSPAGETEVLQQMRSFHFRVEGVSRTHLELYLGFGLLLGVYLLLQAVLLWQLSGLARTQPRRVAGIVLSIFIASAGTTVLAWMYILPTPAIFSTVVAGCVGLAYIRVRSDQTRGRARRNDRTPTTARHVEERGPERTRQLGAGLRDPQPPPPGGSGR